MMGPRLTSGFLLSALTAACLVCHAIAGAVWPESHSGYDYGFDTASILRKRQYGEERVIVRGAPVGNLTSIPLRPEIRDLQKDEDKWTLFILGLDMMGHDDQNHPLSYYQIAGIHGVPYIPWGGVKPKPGSEQSGYCTHQSILFPTWHRPYLALFEQILYDHIQLIASWWQDASERERYQKAAIDFRIPYWDWATRPPVDEDLLPRIVSAYNLITVTGPSGEQTIRNPLFNFRFHPLNASDFYTSPWNLWSTTMRSPSSGTADAESNNTLVSLSLDNGQAAVQQRVYNLFSSYDNYTAFSNEAWFPEGDQSGYDSVESVHDTIHAFCGMGGHMAFIPFSSFDPLFWLHHANVDRLFAMWQTMYWRSWMTPQPARTASYTTSAGEIVDGQTALTPFFADEDGAFWTSDMVRNPEVFGYNYADTLGSKFGADGDSDDNWQAARRITATVNRLYGQSSPARLGFSLPREQWRRRVRPQPANPRTNAWWSSSSPDPEPDTVLKGNMYREWKVNIRAQKQVLDGTYFIHVFGGDPPASPQEWMTAPNLVGSLSIFAAPMAYSHHGMHPEGSNLVSGTIPLTSFLTSSVVAGSIPSLDVADVEPYLRQKLQPRVIHANGTVVDLSSVRDLCLSVVSSEVEAPSTEFELPKWGAPEIHFNLT